MDELSTLINERIAKLRLKLQDTSRRNPLINNVLSSKSSAFIRVVDEKPQSILDHLCIEDREMQLVSLPSLEIDPIDEDTNEFKSAFQNALITDEEYLKVCEAIDFERDENASSKQEQAIRTLKDKVRPLLGLPERPTSDKNVDLINHAKSHGISPSSNLPNASYNAEDDRHDDDLLQTLLLPKTFQYRLARIQSKLRSFKEERGVDVAYIVIGYLKWTLPNNENGDEFKSPIALIPVDLEKSKTDDGEIYTITKKDDVILNPSLIHKLNTEAMLNLDSIEKYFEGNELDIEELFEALNDIQPKNMHWSVHREATFGIYPFQGIDLYNDLDPEVNDFSEFSIVSQLMLGQQVSVSDGENYSEHDIDREQGSKLVPKLVMDADSSQFLALMKVANGSNVALEGPPGSGKSQTIVNAIANSINKGKKVLFVAQKNTALEVVYSRLQALGLHNFVLPLMGDHSNTEDFYDAIKSRLELSPSSNKKHFNELQKRSIGKKFHLSSYIKAITTKVDGTDLSVHEVLGLYISHKEHLEKLPISIRRKEFESEKFSEKFELDDIYKAANFMSDLISRSYEIQQQSESIWGNIDFSKIELEKINRIVSNSRILLQDFESNICELPNDQKEAILQIFELESNILSKLLSNHGLLNTTEAVLNLINQYGFEYVDKFFHDLSQINDIYHSSDLSKDDRQYVDKLSLYKKGFEWYSENFDNDNISVDILNDLRKQLADQKSCLDEIHKYLQAYEDISGTKLNGSIFTKFKRLLPFKGIVSTAAELFIESGQSTIINEIKDLRSLLRYADKNLTASSLPDIQLLRSFNSTISKSNFISRLSSKYKSAVLSVNELVVADIKMLSHVDISKVIQEVIDKVAEYHNLAISDFLPENFSDVQKFISDTNDFFDHLVVIMSKFDINFKDLMKLLRSKTTFELVESLYESFECFEDLNVFTEEYYCSLDKKLNFLNDGFDSLLEIVRVTDDKSIFSFESKVKYIDSLEKYVTATHEREMFTSSFNFDTNAEILDFDFDFIRELRMKEDSNLDDFYKITKIDDSSWIYNFIKSAENLREDFQSIKADSSSLQRIRFSDTRNLIENIVEDQSGFNNLIKQRSILEEAKTNGFSNIFMPFFDLGLSEDISKYIVAIITSGLIAKVEKDHSMDLLNFDGLSLESARQKFQQYDNELIKLSAAEVAQSADSVCSPPGGISYGRKSEYTEQSLLNHELQKKRRTSPRKVIKRAQNALMELFPCWMMVPTGVAQSLPRKELFDLVIIDEASQMTPEHSISALMRGKNALIAGDTNQLPPTNFFKGVSSEEEEDEDIATVEESILELANINFHPKHRLLWHYRSRHEDLISFSNHYVYDSELVIFPSPMPKSSKLGISLIQVDGTFQRGINPQEAQVMTEAIVDFMKTSPERSLGVAVMNQSQQEQLEAQVQQAADKDRDVSKYIEYWTAHREGLEKFFIKNLENVQGDERDVIFIGTVYGRDAQGKFYQRFGPINGASGKRRLNVLFTRAKEQIVTFSSIPMGDFSPSASNVGATLLRRWLEFCATGRLGELAHNHDRAGHTDSPFEDHVIEVINSLGYVAVPQVGVSSYFIDIGVKHPTYEFGYICGVECDGASYHSSKSARDRDRLREEVLNRLGWDLYRIWSTDWFRDVLSCREQLKRYLDGRLRELLGSTDAVVKRSTDDQNVDVDQMMFEPYDESHDKNGDEDEHDDINDISEHIPQSVKSDKFVEKNTKFTVKYLNGPRAGVSTKFWFSGKTNDHTHLLDGYVSIGDDSPLGGAVNGAELNEVCSFSHGDNNIEVKVINIE